VSASCWRSTARPSAAASIEHRTRAALHINSGRAHRTRMVFCQLAACTGRELRRGPLPQSPHDCLAVALALACPDCESRMPRGRQPRHPGAGSSVRSACGRSFPEQPRSLRIPSPRRPSLNTTSRTAETLGHEWRWLGIAVGSRCLCASGSSVVVHTPKEVR
jgi:hypothetical protein